MTRMAWTAEDRRKYAPAIQEVLRQGMIVAGLRLARGRRRRPTAAIIDTQSVRTGPQRGPRGGACPPACHRLDRGDAGKKVKGRKRVLLVDVEGDPLGIRVVPADVHE